MDIKMEMNPRFKQDERINMATTQAKKAYSKIGLALFALVVVSVVFQYAAVYGANAYISMTGSNIANNEWFVWFITFAPIYFFAIPTAILIMRGLPIERVEKEKIGLKKFIVYILMAMSINTIGNYVGNILAALLSGGSAQNGVLNYVMQDNIFKVLIIVIAAPMLEELVFRKQIIDRCAQFGETQAIVYSSLAFGLFHMNLYQFFYAFGIGLIMGYIYTKTRDIKLSVIMHIFINILGSIVAPYVISKVDIDVVNQILVGQVDEAALMQAAGGIMTYAIYLIIILVLSIVGVILIIKNRKEFTVRKKENQLCKGERFKNIYLNPGFILFAVLCVGFTVRALM